MYADCADAILEPTLFHDTMRDTLPVAFAVAVNAHVPYRVGSRAHPTKTTLRSGQRRDFHAPGSSNTPIDSTCEVCGNMFTTPAFFIT